MVMLIFYPANSIIWCNNLPLQRMTLFGIRTVLHTARLVKLRFEDDEDQFKYFVWTRQLWWILRSRFLDLNIIEPLQSVLENRISICYPQLTSLQDRSRFLHWKCYNIPILTILDFNNSIPRKASVHTNIALYFINKILYLIFLSF